MRHRATTSALLLMLMPLAGCAPRVDDPGSIDAIRAAAAAYVTAINAGDVDAAMAPFAENAIYALPNMAPAAGREAIRVAHQAWLGQVTNDFAVEVEDIRVSGDRAVARGTWTNTTTPRSGSGPADTDAGSWLGFYERQADGSWKWVWVVPNSSRPIPGATADGADEQALAKLQEEWAQAEAGKDGDAFDRLLAKDFAANVDGRAMTRAQYMADMIRRDVTVESAAVSDVKSLVFGDHAFVTGTYAVKSATRGRDSSARYWFADVWVKRDGRWQALTTTATSQAMP